MPVVRRVCVWLVALSACGEGSTSIDGGRGIDAPPLIDAPGTDSGATDAVEPDALDVPLLHNIVGMAAGGNHLVSSIGHTCAWLIDGSATCWGENFYGQLGDSTTGAGRSRPGVVPGLSGVAGMAAGGVHTCAALTDGTARCWGWNGGGQLGDGTTMQRTAPVAVIDLTGVAAVTAGGGSHSCARVTDGTARCWGANFSGQIGDSTTMDRTTPTTVTNLAAATAVDAGLHHTCAVVTGGSAKCWGNNIAGQLGDGTVMYRSVPVTPMSLSGVAGIVTGDSHTCAWLMDGTVRCWGGNGSGQLGDGSTMTRYTPVTVTGLANVVGMAAGLAHTCAHLDDGTVRCWGENGNGQLGDGTTMRRSAPTPVTGLTNVAGITAGVSYTCAWLTDGTARCWGRNDSGQLGIGENGGQSVTPRGVIE